MSDLWSQSLEEKKIAGIYIRVSTEDQARGEHVNKDTLLTILLLLYINIVLTLCIMLIFYF